MNGIDNPVEAIREAYKEEQQPGHQTVQLALAVLGTFVPLIAIYNAVRQHFTGEEAKKRVEGLFSEILNILNALGKNIDGLSAKIESPEFLQTMIEAVDRTARTASKRKVKRFAAVLAHELVFGDSSEQGWEDAAAYLRDIAELSEADIKVLSYLYKFQSRIFAGNRLPNHNDVYDSYAQLLGHAEDRGIHRDEFYARCAKLSGFGLVLPVEKKKGYVGPDDYSFRLTLMGKHLVEVLRKTGQQTKA